MAKPTVATADITGFGHNPLRSTGLASKKSDNASMLSGSAGGGIGKTAVNFAGGSGGRRTPDSSNGPVQGKSYGAPTLKMLNPELYKEIEK